MEEPYDFGYGLQPQGNPPQNSPPLSFTLTNPTFEFDNQRMNIQPFPQKRVRVGEGTTPEERKELARKQLRINYKHNRKLREMEQLAQVMEYGGTFETFQYQQEMKKRAKDEMLQSFTAYYHKINRMSQHGNIIHIERLLHMWEAETRNAFSHIEDWEQVVKSHLGSLHSKSQNKQKYEQYLVWKTPKGVMEEMLQKLEETATFSEEHVHDAVEYYSFDNVEVWRNFFQNLLDMEQQEQMKYQSEVAVECFVFSDEETDNPFGTRFIRIPEMQDFIDATDSKVKDRVKLEHNGNLISGVILNIESYYHNGWISSCIHMKLKHRIKLNPNDSFKLMVEPNMSSFKAMRSTLEKIVIEPTDLVKCIIAGDPNMLVPFSVRSCFEQDAKFAKDEFFSELWQKFQIKLDESQTRAVVQSLQSQLYAIIGPPGTGKTTVGVAILAAWLASSSKESLIFPDTCQHYVVCAQRNAAVDNFLRQAAQLLPEYQHHFLRIPSSLWYESSADDNVDLLKFTLGNMITTDKIDKVKVLFVTPSMLQSKLLKDCSIQRLLVDEASLALEPALMGAIMGKDVQQVIMIGDDRQNKPVVKSQDAATGGLTLSMFERLIKCKFPNYSLSQQYRMASNLSWFTSQFYDKYVTARDYPPLPRIPHMQHNSIFLHTPAVEMQNKKSTFNTGQSFMAARLCWKLIQADVNPNDIVILTMYGAQLKELQCEFKAYADHLSLGAIKMRQKQNKIVSHDAQLLLKITTATVDSFQGQERPLVVLITSRSNAQGRVGFIADSNRLNVAMSRAQNCRIIVGNALTLMQSNNEHWLNIIKWHKDRKAVIDIQDYINEWKPHSNVNKQSDC